MRYSTIGDIARQTGLPVATIRFYEAKKLLPAADRLPNNRRVYGSEIVKRIVFIQSCRKAGMSLPAIANMLKLLEVDGQPCAQVLAIADRAARELSLRISELQAARRELSRFSALCSADQCGPAPLDCAMLAGFGAK